MAILATRTVEWEFDAGVWTDISADVVLIGTRRGRNRELGAFETGQMVLILRNDTRKYDPDHSAGPYYGKLRPNRRVRFRATYNGVTYPVFQGYVDRITQQYGGPNDAIAQVELSDLFKILHQAELPASVYAAEVLADSPLYWWRLGEPAGSTTVMDAVAGVPGAVLGGALGTAGLVTRDGDAALSTAGNANEGVYVAGSAASVPTGPTNAGNYTVEFLVYFRTITPGTRYSLFSARSAADGTPGLDIYVADFDGKLYANGATGVTITTGVVYHVAVTNAAGPPLYVNAVSVARGGGSRGDGDFYIGGYGNYLSTAYNSPDGVIDELAIYNTNLSSARVAAHNSAARTPWKGDLPGTRLGRILDLAGVPAGDRNIDIGSTVLQSTSL